MRNSVGIGTGGRTCGKEKGEDGDVHQQAAEAARSQVRTGNLTVKTGGGGGGP